MKVNRAQVNIGLAIRHLRKQRGLTMVQVSRKVGLSESMVSLIERGKRDTTVGTLQKLVQAVGGRCRMIVEPREFPAPPDKGLTT